MNIHTFAIFLHTLSLILVSFAVGFSVRFPIAMCTSTMAIGSSDWRSNRPVCHDWQ